MSQTAPRLVLLHDTATYVDGSDSAEQSVPSLHPEGELHVPAVPHDGCCEITPA